MALIRLVQNTLSWAANQVLSGTNNTAPNQGSTSANGIVVPSGVSSLITSGLLNTQYLELVSNTYKAAFGAVSNGTGSSVNGTLATSGGSNNRIGFSLGSTVGTYAQQRFVAKPSGIYGGNISLPFSYYFIVEFVLNNLGTSDFFNIGIYSPADSTTFWPTASPWLVSSANQQQDARWLVQIQPTASASQARLLTMTAAGSLTTGSWVTIPNAVGYESRGTLIVQKQDNNTLNAYITTSRGINSWQNKLASATLIGSTTSLGWQSSNYTSVPISAVAVNGSGVASTSEIGQPTLILI